MPTLVLASGSAHRRRLLEDAGVAPLIDPSALDERSLEAPLAQSGVTPDEVAAILAEAKAADVSERHPGALVIGADQTLALGDRRFHKPEDMEAARRTLLALSGERHALHSAVAIVRDGETLWEKPFLTGEANMSHTLANLEHHHFKYASFRRPGDIHVHFFGTATLSFADGVTTQEGDVFEIEAAPFTLPLRNPLARAAEQTVTVRAL